jgi:hypothetical protein
MIGTVLMIDEIPNFKVIMAGLLNNIITKAHSTQPQDQLAPQNFANILSAFTKLLEYEFSLSPHYVDDV